MKLNASTKDLKEVVSRLANVPGAIIGVPVTQAVRFEADMDGLKLTRMSSEASLSVTLEAASIDDADGPFFVNYNSLSRMVDQLPAKEVSLESDEKKLHFRSGSAKGAVQVFAEMDIEAPEAEMETEHIKLPIEMIVAGLQFAGMAMHKDESAQGFCGICIRMLGDRLAFIATDRKWVQIYFFDCKLPVDCIIAGKTVEAILRALGKQAGACTLAIGERTLQLISHDTDANFALMQYAYPDLTRFTDQPETSIQSKIRICRRDFVEAIKNASGIADDLGREVQVVATKTDLTILANNGQDSEIAFNLNCKATESATFIVASTPIFTSLGNFIEHEEIELILYPQALFVRESTKLAVFALRVA